MRAVWGFLLAAVCLHIAQGLMCFTCNTPTTSSECNEPTNCTALSPKFSVCKTTVMSPDVGFPFQGNEMVYRQCAESCIRTGQNWLGITKKILCCNVDLCNRNGIRDGSSPDPCDSGIRMSPGLVTVTLSLVSAAVFTSLLA